MADWERLLMEVAQQTNRIVQEANEFQEEMVAKIEAAKQDDIIKGLANINRRLDEIEKRLPSMQDDDGSGLPEANIKG